MTVYECDLSQENRDALEGLHMVEEAISEYSPITMFDECFTEAFGSKKKTEAAKKQADAIKAKEAANAKASEKGVSGLRKALDAVLGMCRKIINAIDNFFQEHNFDKEEKEAYARFKEACKQDPSLKNKKITVRDYKKVQAQYQELMKECEKELEAVKKNADHPLDKLMNKMTNFVKDNTKGVAVSLGATAAINVASTNRQFAKFIRAAMHSDAEVMQKMQDVMGKKQFKAMDRDLRSLGHWISLKKKWMSVTNSLYTDVTSAMLAPFFDLRETLHGRVVDPRENGGQVQVLRMMHKNKDVGKTMDKGAKVAANVGYHGVISGAKDKLGYLGRKIIRPQKAEREGVYGGTLVGAAADAVKSAAHPVGKVGRSK